MKKVYFGAIFLIIMGHDIVGQRADYEFLATANLNVVYRMTASRDSNFLDHIITEKMVLALGDRFSSFQNLNFLLNLKEIEALRQNNIEITSTLASQIFRKYPLRIRHLVFKHYDAKKLVTHDNVFVDNYEYTEPLNGFQWHITGNEKTFLGHKVQEATTTYGCRKWVAWFTPNIPISDGPYKFHGLPGLILKVADSKNHYVWELEYIETKDLVAENVEVEISASRMKTTLAEFIRMRNNFTKSAGNIVAMHTSDPEIRAIASANAASRNNFIELCAE